MRRIASVVVLRIKHDSAVCALVYYGHSDRSDSRCAMQPKSQKNPRAHKNKISTPPPKKPKIPPLKRGILWTWVFSCRKSTFFQASIKLTHPFPAPELRTKIFMDMRIFLKICRCCFPHPPEVKTFMGSLSCMTCLQQTKLP